MNFGDLVRSLRKAQGLDIQTLAERSGVETSTISRVENARTQVTILTAIRLVEGLGASLADVVAGVIPGRSPESGQQLTVDGHAVPTVSDVEQFLAYFQGNPEEGKIWLADLLNKVASANRSASQAVGGETARPFGHQDIHKLLFDSPVYRFEIQYPPECSASDILSIYRCGGILTLVDIGEYIRKVRREKQVTLAHLERVTKFSQGVLSRLESPVVEHLKLTDILVLDQQLGQEGTLLSMFWEVYTFFERLLRRHPDSAELDMKLTSIFVTTCRWLQALNPEDRSWMEYMGSERLA